MNEGVDFERWLRRRVLGLLHAGRIGGGDRLPSIRSLAAEHGVDHREVAEAYRVLERDGLVEIRAGSGVFVAGTERTPGLPEERVRFLTEFLVEGRARGLPRERLGELVARCASARLRCGCIESNVDHLVAISGELESDFSLEVVPILVDPDGAGSSLSREVLEGLDLLVTTVFHGHTARAARGREGRPCVVLTLNEEFTAELDRRLRRQPITAVIADPRLAERARAYLSVTAHRERVEFVTVDELRSREIDLASDAVVISRAARRRLGLEEYHFIPSPPTVISPASAEELLELVVRLALE